ncbi:MAG: hypothetical protein KQJ78_24210 [Deltaproteobacteria bacterium]|nr:hypothetical protein [Deltaproteobacteria bacterium]
MVKAARRKVSFGLWVLPAVLVLWMAAAPASAANDSPVQGQTPMLVVKGSYNFVPGAWADYWVKNLKKGENYDMRICTLERAKYEGQNAVWMEIKVDMKGQPGVITKVLCLETPDGPGQAKEVIVQPQGYDPFTVPASFLAEQGGEAGEVQTFDPKASAKEVTVRFKKRGTKMKAIKVNGVDDQGRVVEALVSQEIPPLGLIKATTSEIEMTIQDWGLGGKSQIRGEPMNFYVWIAAQVGKALTSPAAEQGN